MLRSEVTKIANSKGQYSMIGKFGGGNRAILATKEPPP